MIQHHISEHARQKILKEIAVRAQKHVLDLTYNWYELSFGFRLFQDANFGDRKQQVPVLPEIRAHIESIIARFKHTKTYSKPILLPAKAITSPRETVEVQPFIVLCPSDIITLVNTLFPERRPSSSHLNKDAERRGGLASSASSMSGISMPFRSASATATDASSILSASASSMTSDTTSREPLLDTGSINPNVPLGQAYVESKVEPSETYGRHLRMACSEMSRILGIDATSGSCHPCKERWAVLYISADGKQLKHRMRKDSDDEDEHDEDSHDTDSSDDEGTGAIDLENDYHQLKEAIAKLVEEYEIPKELAPDSESKSFSNRMTTRKGGRGRGLGRVASESFASRNPYNQPQTQTQSQLTNLIASQRNVPARHRSPQHPRSNSNPQNPNERQESNSVLVTMLESAMLQCQARSDFVNALMYHKTLASLRRLSSPTLVKNGYAALLNYFSRGPRDSLSKSANAIEEFEAWFVWLKQSQERSDGMIEEMMIGFKNLRDKMWYISDVRGSKEYDDAKNVALALKIMGQPTKTLDGKPIQTPRKYSKSTSNNFALRNEAQLVDVMAASQDFGGPNKLSDEQSDITLKWINQYGIENFCKGEERIHRFCLEIDKCVNKIVADNLMEGPTLWASDLYKRDQQILDSGRQKGDLFLTGVGTLSVAGDEEYETHGRPGSRNLDFAQRPSHSSLRSVANRNVSGHSFDQSPWGTSPVESPDYFGGSSPFMSIDTATTFWSPFQTQAQSPTSAASIRPRTASSSKGTVMLKQSASVNEEKRRFLLDLKQTLTGLLLSDLGTLVFANGSETDSWFSGDVLEDCIQRRDEEELRRKKQLAKKKSMKSLRKQTPVDTLGRIERAQAASPVAGSDAHYSAGEHSSTSSDATSRSAGVAAAKRAGLLEFPYNVAFRRLLTRFATHPNPYSKLHALYELELLIIASLSSRSGRSYNNRRDTLPAVAQSPTLGAAPEYSSREPATQHSRAQNIEEAIANCSERRAHTTTDRSSPVPRHNGARSPVGPPSTDMIVEVIQGLLRDANIRPKSLFRDLQYIASFVPAQMLDKTERGKAFWDVGLAALGLKQDVCRIMVEIVDEVINASNTSRSAAVQPQPPTEKGSDRNATPVPEPTSRYNMEDAARMLLITAKEGDAVAERELAIFYLTSPELLHRAVLPLTKPSEVFKTELLNRERKASQDPARSDPMTMCVAQHWMEQSMKGGDGLAAKYLRQRSELESIPSRA